MKNIFIDGINGFVGSAAADFFQKKGLNIIGLIRERNRKSRPEILDKCTIVQGDILDRDLLRNILSKYEIDYVLHLAASPIVRICNSDPYSAYMTNVVGTLNLLEAVRSLVRKPEKIIVMTSDKAYGPHAVLPYVEDAPLVAADSYCTSKACQDMVARSYAMTYGLPVIVVRAGNLYGPGDLNLSRLIPNSILKLLAGESPTLYSGVANYIREFIYIDNILSTYDTLFSRGNPGEAYNVGGTKPQKILDVITLIRDKINPDIKIELVEKEFFEIKEQYLDSTKLRNLGWTPAVNLDEGLSRTIDWFRKREVSCSKS